MPPRKQSRAQVLSGVLGYEAADQEQAMSPHGSSHGPGGTHSEIVPQQLHDQGAVFVGLFIQRVQLSNRLIERLKQRAFS